MSTDDPLTDPFHEIFEQVHAVLTEQTNSVSFDVHWDPINFMKSQYDVYETVRLSSVITVTGTALRAQAITCGQYVKCYWPLRGAGVLERLEAAVRSPLRYSQGMISLSYILYSLLSTGLNYWAA